jgi:hypothetical protein
MTSAVLVVLITAGASVFSAVLTYRIGHRQAGSHDEDRALTGMVSLSQERGAEITRLHSETDALRAEVARLLATQRDERERWRAERRALITTMRNLSAPGSAPGPASSPGLGEVPLPLEPLPDDDDL